MIRVLQVVGVAAASLLLAACSSGTGYSDLDREATEADLLPSELPAYATERWDADSVRYVGERDDVSYYVGTTDEPRGGVCVLHYASGDDWFGACGGPLGVTSSGGGRTVVVAPDGSEELESGVRVGENVAVTG